MKYSRGIEFVLLAIIVIAAKTSLAGEVQTKGKVCGDPQAKCQMPAEAVKGAQPNDLTFNLTQSIVWQNNYYSDNFFAIMLKSKKAIPDDGPVSNKKCSGYFTEQDRAKIQNDFKDSKVFTSRTGCTGQMFHYTNYNTQYNFIAVYGGDTKAAADIALKKAKSLGYKDANIRKMQVVFEYGD